MAERCDTCWHAVDLHEGERCRWPGCECGHVVQLELQTWAVVPSKRRLRTDLLALVDSLRDQAHGVVVVDNNDERDGAVDDEIAARGFAGARLQHIHLPGYPPNLSRLYNAGVEVVDALMASLGTERYNVCLLNDDVVVPAGWAVSLEKALRGTPAAMAYTDRLGRSVLALMTAPPPDFSHTATLWACMLRGELKLRYDEQFVWWYGDNDIDLRCRLDHGGTIAVPGPMPDHTHPSEETFNDPVLSRIANTDDAARFNAKWAARMASL